jgi:NADPH:quinone reductase-like Zn-dependent oxidoreductase
VKAIVQDGYGTPDVLRLADVDRPTVGDDGVLVRVRAASLNPLDWRRVRGSPFVIRLGEGLRRPRSPVLGVDAAGWVEEVGDAVTHLRPGDEVFGVGKGSLAEYVRGGTFAPKPANLTFEEAAAVPVAGWTALQGLRDRGGLRSGHRVLVYGAGGGVGTFTVQIAKALGGEVTAVTSTEKVDLVSSLGADHVVDYTKEDPTRSGARCDLVVDIGGDRSISDWRRTLKPGGKLILAGAGKRFGGPVGRFLAGSVRSRVLRQRVDAFISWESVEDLDTLRHLIENGKVTPVMDRTYPLAEAAEAVRYLESERASGKVVITI